MAKNQFLAGVGRALLFSGDTLIGVAKTLTESTFNFSISSEEIRGGEANSLWGKYFHDSALTVTMTDAMFNMEYVAKNLGVDVEMGGITWYESSSAGETPSASGVITLTKTPVAFEGSLLVWYKKPSDANWQVATATQSGGTYSITIAGATAADKYCIKYQYQDASAKSLTISTKYVPSVLHVVILNDLFAGDTADVGTATKYGRLITDIPSLQLDGAMDLSLTSSSAATISLSGSALAVETTTSCEEEPYYGTMTQQIFSADWRSDVVAVAVENAEMSLAPSATETLAVRVVYGGTIASQRKDNSNFIFTVESGTSATVSTAGLVTASGSATGDTVISVELKNASGTGTGIVGYAVVSVSA